MLDDYGKKKILIPVILNDTEILILQHSHSLVEIIEPIKHSDAELRI